MASLAARRRKALQLVRRHPVKRPLRQYKKVSWQRRHHTLHRVVMTILMGRRLRRDEHVHHIDGNKWNNLPSNLILLPARTHASRAARKHALVRYCEVCGEPYLSRQAGRARYCSHACNYAARRAHRRGVPLPPPPLHPWRQ